MIHAMPVAGAGLGIRRALLNDLQQMNAAVDFLEVTPDNWIHTAGKPLKQLHELSARYPMLAHGLSLSLGGTDPLDVDFIAELKIFLDTHRVHVYSEHLSFCSAEGHLYDLMPIPFTEEAIKNTTQRIREVQERLERRIAIENVSYYAAPYQVLSEIDFISAILVEADCDLLLDVNNVYVNSINHHYNAQDFIRAIPTERVAYLHVAGHYTQAEDLRIDTHAAPVCDPVWELLAYTYRQHGIKPTVLERDFNFPPFVDLLKEVQQIQAIQQSVQGNG
ncbi:MAG: DUF692 domain-containing protein [Pseudomonadales bacterium]